MKAYRRIPSGFAAARFGGRTENADGFTGRKHTVPLLLPRRDWDRGDRRKVQEGVRNLQQAQSTTVRAIASGEFPLSLKPHPEANVSAGGALDRKEAFGDDSRG